MKRELYVNFLLMKYLFLSMEQVNSLADHEKELYVKQIEEYLNNGNI